jgi:hypothetical protein
MGGGISTSVSLNLRNRKYGTRVCGHSHGSLRTCFFLSLFVGEVACVWVESPFVIRLCNRLLL